MVYCKSCGNGCGILFNILITTVLLSAIMLSGCGSSMPAISSYKFIPKKGIKKPNPNYYLVLPSDTLIAIAMRLDLDYKLLAQYNNLKKPYTLSVGKRIRITKPPVNTYAAKTKASHRQIIKKLKQPAVYSSKANANWIWPTIGKVQGKFRNKGIDIVAARNTAIKAVQSGEVVYAGNGLKGYGNLIIIKHNNNFLSAYAHNEVLLAHEGHSVAQGTVIARMGSSAASSVMLHFEIRKNGKPVDPLRYLP